MGDVGTAAFGEDVMPMMLDYDTFTSKVVKKQASRGSQCVA